MAQVPAVSRSSRGSLATNGLHPIDVLRRQFDTMFDRMWSNFLSPWEDESGQLHIWDFKVFENDQNEIVVRADLPGFDQNEIDVRLTNNQLAIQAEKEQKEDGQQEFRSFYRSVTLPSEVKSDDVSATYRNGVLELRIPKAENAQTKRIKVQSNGA